MGREGKCTEQQKCVMNRAGHEHAIISLDSQILSPFTPASRPEQDVLKSQQQSGSINCLCTTVETERNTSCYPNNTHHQPGNDRTHNCVCQTRHTFNLHGEEGQGSQKCFFVWDERLASCSTITVTLFAAAPTRSRGGGSHRKSINNKDFRVRMGSWDWFRHVSLRLVKPQGDAAGQTQDSRCLFWASWRGSLHPQDVACNTAALCWRVSGSGAEKKGHISGAESKDLTPLGFDHRQTRASNSVTSFSGATIDSPPPLPACKLKWGGVALWMNAMWDHQLASTKMYSWHIDIKSSTNQNNHKDHLSVS